MEGTELEGEPNMPNASSPLELTDRCRGICSHLLCSTGQVSVSLPTTSNWGGWCHGQAATVEAPFPNPHNSSPFSLFLPKSGYLF